MLVTVAEAGAATCGPRFGAIVRKAGLAQNPSPNRYLDLKFDYTGGVVFPHI